MKPLLPLENKPAPLKPLGPFPCSNYMLVALATGMPALQEAVI